MPRFAAAAFVVLVACGGTPPPPATPTAGEPPVVDVAPSAESAEGDGSPDKLVEAAPRDARAPAGYVEVEVGNVVAAHGGHAVILLDPAQQIAVPIFIGGTEALAIDLRHNKQRYLRPLTHDLIDEIMNQLGGKLEKVQVDAIRDDTFIGSIYLRHEGRLVEIDARPSDAIALAIGNRVPIYVNQAVLDEAGIKRDEVMPSDDSDDFPKGT